MVKPALDVSKIDVLQAQINVSISQARELVSSWLPAAPTKAAGQSSGPAQVSQTPADGNEDDFKPLPPRLGLGAPIPKHFYDEDSRLRKDISSTDLLRRKLMGSKRPASQISEHSSGKAQRLHEKNRKAQEESDSEEDVGRSALGKSKRQKLQNTQKTKRDTENEDDPSKVTIMEKANREKKDQKTVQERQDDSVSAIPKSSISPNNEAPVKAEGSVRADDCQNPGKKKKKKKKKKHPQDKQGKDNAVGGQPV